MKKTIICLILGLVIASGYAQTRIDSTFSFQTDPNKKYSLYIPTGYSPTDPHKLMVGLHPFNVSRWDAEAWCDTLTVFAETNNLLLACPDGGADGRIDDAIDTAFTSALLDSMSIWYNIDTDNVFAMGFSVGGQTVYTYGLNHVEKFKGFMPIGSAMGGTSLVNSVLGNANLKPFYLVHGANDSQGSRFTPIKDSITDNGACVMFNLMSGVGHTIDFPNRNQILTDAFNYIDTVTCVAPVDPTGLAEMVVYEEAKAIRLIHNSTNRAQGLKLLISEDAPPLSFEVLSISGQLKQHGPLPSGLTRIELTELVKPGQYILRIAGAGLEKSFRFQVLE